MLSILLLLNLLILTSVYGQQDQMTFSEALDIHLPKYNERANKAYRYNQVERAEFLFDSLVTHCLRGTVLDDFVLKDLKEKPVSLQDFQKPVLLMTSASWIIPSKGEVPALNRLAEKYHDRIDFVILFWDTREKARESAGAYNEFIRVLYVDELENSSPYIIKKMKHSLGFPTTFLLDQDKVILNITRKFTHPYGLAFEKSFDLNYEALSSVVSSLVFDPGSEFATAQEVVSPE